MFIFIALFAGLFLTTFLSAPLMGAGWAWDADNALGFCSLGGLLYLTVPSNFRHDGQQHVLLGYAVLLMVLAHAFWFLIRDPVLLQYLKPGALVYMWAGLAAAVLLLLLVSLSVLPPRRMLHKDHASFRYWHIVLGITCVAAATYHILGSGFYLSTWYQKILFTGVVLGMIASRQRGTGKKPYRPMSLSTFLILSAAGVVLFTLVRNVAG
jgi:hypothetical protein